MTNGESIYRPDGSANLDDAARRFEEPRDTHESVKDDDKDISRRDFVLGVIALMGGAAIGNELGNLGRDAMESNALANAEDKLDPSEIEAADKSAEQLSSLVEEYKKGLQNQGLSDNEIDQKVRSYVLRTLDSFNKKELVPNIVPKSSFSIVSPESQE